MVAARIRARKHEYTHDFNAGLLCTTTRFSPSKAFDLGHSHMPMPLSARMRYLNNSFAALELDHVELGDCSLHRRNRRRHWPVVGAGVTIDWRVQNKRRAQGTVWTARTEPTTNPRRGKRVNKNWYTCSTYEYMIQHRNIDHMDMKMDTYSLVTISSCQQYSYGL